MNKTARHTASDVARVYALAEKRFHPNGPELAKLREANVPEYHIDALYPESIMTWIPKIGARFRSPNARLKFVQLMEVVPREWEDYDFWYDLDQAGHSDFLIELSVDFQTHRTLKRVAETLVNDPACDEQSPDKMREYFGLIAAMITIASNWGNYPELHNRIDEYMSLLDEGLEALGLPAVDVSLGFQ